MNFYLILHLITVHYIVYLSHHNKIISGHPLSLHVFEKRQESCRLTPLNTDEKVQVFRQGGNQIRICLVLFGEKKKRN